MHTSQPVMEQGLSDGTYIEYWTNDNHFMCLRTKDVTEICNKVMQNEPTCNRSQDTMGSDFDSDILGYSCSSVKTHF